MVAAATAVAPKVVGRQSSNMSSPVSTMNTWQVANNDPGTAQATPQQIYTQIASGGVDLIPVQMSGFGSSVEVCLQYNPSGGKTVTGPPLIWIVGRDANGVVRRLADVDGAIEWTLTPDTANDCASATTASYTLPIVVDAMGCDQVWVLVETAATGTAFTKANAAAILAHVL
jgi:hypothetical protein